MNYRESGIEKFINNHKDKFTSLCSQHYVKSLYIFGSSLTDAFHNNSDIDFLYQIDVNRFESIVPIEYDYTDNLLSLEKALSEFFMRKIDLVPDVVITNKYLKDEIEKTKHQIYAA